MCGNQSVFPKWGQAVPPTASGSQSCPENTTGGRDGGRDGWSEIDIGEFTWSEDDISLVLPISICLAHTPAVTHLSVYITTIHLCWSLCILRVLQCESKHQFPAALMSSCVTLTLEICKLEQVLTISFFHTMLADPLYDISREQKTELSIWHSDCILWILFAYLAFLRAHARDESLMTLELCYLY